MGNVVTNIAGYFFNSLIDWLEEKLLALSAFAISFINNYVLSFFENEIIDAFMDFSTWINYFVFGVALLVVIVDIAEEKASDKPVYWSVVFTNVAKAFAFAGFARWLAVLAMEISNKITTYFGITIDANKFELSIDEIVNAVLGSNIAIKALLNVIFLIIILFSVIFFCRELTEKIRGNVCTYFYSSIIHP